MNIIRLIIFSFYFVSSVSFSVEFGDDENKPISPDLGLSKKRKNTLNSGTNNQLMPVDLCEDNATGSMAGEEVKADQLVKGEATDGLADSLPRQQAIPLSSRIAQPEKARQEDPQIKEKAAIIEECKATYRQALLACSYDDFQRIANQGMSSINDSLERLELETYPPDGWGLQYTLPLIGQTKAVKVKHKNRQIPNQWSWNLSNDTQQFIANDEKQAVSIYTDWKTKHPVLCIKSRSPGKDNSTAIRLSFIDSIGTPNTNPPIYNGEYMSMLEYLKGCLEKHTDTEIEVGFLSLTSQYDKYHCKAWLAEVIRKTPDFSSLIDTLWESAEDLGKSLEKEYRNASPENLKLSLLTKLPPKYMMAVQNPKVIRKYIDNYQGNPADKAKLETLLKKEVYSNVEYYTEKGKRIIDINSHLERKSLKYMLELVVKELDLPDQYLQDFRQFLRENSPYYDQTDENKEALLQSEIRI